MTQQMIRAELSVVRAAAVAWRNGLAGLLAGLLGFGLIKGRSDVSGISAPWRIVVGALLLAALVVAAYSALRLLRAAHGRPRRRPLASVGSRLAADRDEAAESLVALDRGVAGTLTCAVLLVAAVAVTWYGPPAGKPRLQVVIGGEIVCGSVVRASGDRLTLRTDTGERIIDLSRIDGLQPVDECGS
ncbi:hypothetical protein ABZY09_45820 [Streptomyces sp. NPDC002928]|uniref:hypothetical protein n=1 Tax=Streptomyces sp. NPDC002928 TaxID=3154440 RepID=UPI0033BEE924